MKLSLKIALVYYFLLVMTACSSPDRASDTNGDEMNGTEMKSDRNDSAMNANDTTQLPDTVRE